MNNELGRESISQPVVDDDSEKRRKRDDVDSKDSMESYKDTPDAIHGSDVPRDSDDLDVSESLNHSEEPIESNNSTQSQPSPYLSEPGDFIRDCLREHRLLIIPESVCIISLGRQELFVGETHSLLPDPPKHIAEYPRAAP